MGNSQQKDVDLLETYIDLHESTIQQNSSHCERIYNLMLEHNSSTFEPESPIFLDENINFTDAYEKCLNHSIPYGLFNQPYILPWYQQVLWTLIFGVMIIVALAGNLSVMWIILAHRRMRTVTNLFLLNLAIADFLLASGNASFNFVFMLNSHWPFGGPFCVISNFVANLTVSTSVFTILALSLDRFVAVIRPMRPRMTKLMACSIIFSIWFLSSLFSLPSLLYATTITYKYADDGQRTLCYLVWPDAASGKSYSDHVYNIAFLILTYIIPMTTMMITYTWVGCVLWGSKVIGENTDLQNQVVKSKQRVVHMLVAIMLLFAICWLPYHVYFLYTYYNQEVLHTHFIQHVYLAIYWLAMSNSCYNPIVYYFMNARFRGYFQDIFCFAKPIVKPFNGVEYDGTHKSFPMAPISPSEISNRTRSCRMSFPRGKRNSNSHL
ncbi:tachykinin-like peptides receptor 86C [Uloborus diversus]|uniref:tachykinin-like peptides receptor 86C n=1 Tax=Uloborus diversus TaxID=327109 RepID=UPI0024093DFE|nr:tachykinin-like peptides receptor 86C [Uloborus diversus]